MAALLNWLYQFTQLIHLPNYGLAIVLLTVIVKMILYPLTVKQMRSMVVMQQLAPRVKEIQERYKSKDPQKMQQKIMELYKEHNVNPMSGCLPLLIQLPILIALYRALLHFNYADPLHARFFWIGSLSQVGDPLFILPVLAGITTYVQSRMTTNMTDPTQRIMLITMPLFIAWISSTVPAGLALYWVTFNVVGIVQQHFVNRHTRVLKEALSQGGGSRENR
ncbi:membrane protein insertase YidC [Desulfofundulus thermobenzoicus]|uniref:Membrane protein insertase YidC n=2 Tax=Desulfofundulus thermobenzoicus TaxID=29376 RepID=A0A6N7IUL2_9FIRM|nr:membrane protein insertase YidC [Desulfofundulus thermobenzoicus]HHW43986.1 membrane protein insertase YidC [Desulfotomaculum sp.]